MGKAPDLSDYVEVAERMNEFFEKHPQGSFDSECAFNEVDGRWLAVVKAYAYRDREDPHPGVGLAAEFIPGRTPYTKDSELENAQTSAIGRAILSVGASRAKRVASYEEVRNRIAESNAPDNAQGRQALRDLCEEGALDPVQIANLFQSRMGKPAKSAPNDELLSFINLYKAGAITAESQ